MVAIHADAHNAAATTASCIYEGTIRHRRRSPERQFRYRLSLAYVDLAELPRLLGGRLTAARPGLLRFRRADYLGDASVPLDHAVRDAVQHHSGVRPAGPIRVLTQLRSFGHSFNPVSFYYCFEPGGEQLQAIVAEVTNTPWRERHAYVLVAGGDATGMLRDSSEKRMHVSPLMGMDQRYRFAAAAPGETLSLHIESSQEGQSVFDATLSLRRRPLTEASARQLAWRYPFASVRVLALIYVQALRARLAGASYHPHPQAG
jgi:DUF1365 family protein